MRIIGYCERCHRIRQVYVRQPRHGIQVGICASCDRPTQGNDRLHAEMAYGACAQCARTHNHDVRVHGRCLCPCHPRNQPSKQSNAQPR